MFKKVLAALAVIGLCLVASPSRATYFFNPFTGKLDRTLYNENSQFLNVTTTGNVYVSGTLKCNGSCVSVGSSGIGTSTINNFAYYNTTTTVTGTAAFILSGGVPTATGLIWTNATGTNSLLTNVTTTNLTVTNCTGCGASFTTTSINGLTTTAYTFTGAGGLTVGTSAPGTINLTQATTTLSPTNLTWTYATGTNSILTNVTSTNLNVTNGVFTYTTSTGLSYTNLLGTSATSTYLFATNTNFYALGVNTASVSSTAALLIANYTTTSVAMQINDSRANNCFSLTPSSSVTAWTSSNATATGTFGGKDLLLLGGACNDGVLIIRAANGGVLLQDSSGNPTGQLTANQITLTSGGSTTTLTNTSITLGASATAQGGKFAVDQNGNTSASGTLFVAGASTLANTTITNVTSTNLFSTNGTVSNSTSTNSFVTNASSTGATSTYAYDVNLNAANTTSTNFFASYSSSTAATSTNLYAVSAAVGTLTINGTQILQTVSSTTGVISGVVAAGGCDTGTTNMGIPSPPFGADISISITTSTQQTAGFTYAWQVISGTGTVKVSVCNGTPANATPVASTYNVFWHRY